MLPYRLTVGSQQPPNDVRSLSAVQEFILHHITALARYGFRLLSAGRFSYGHASRERIPFRVVDRYTSL